MARGQSLLLGLQQLAVFLDVARYQLLENLGRVLIGVRRNSGETGKAL